MRHALTLAVLYALVCACVTAQEAPEPVSLFNGRDLAGWTNGARQPVTKGWVVDDGCLHRKSGGGSIFTEDEYLNFIFEFEWKIAPKGNSGIKYRFGRYGGMQNGPEYQILDDAGHPDATRGGGQRKAACLYDILAADTADVTKPAGEWNTGRIVARGPVVEHWLNGKMVLTYDSRTPEFKAAVKDSKFYKKAPDYGTPLRGRIHIQDHGDLVWYRNIRISVLPE